MSNDPVNKTDPLGLYEIDVHYYLTYYLARKTGCFNENVSRLIADADQGTDENPATLPGPGESEKNTKYHALHPGARQGVGSPELWNESLKGSFNIIGLGNYLHYLQDTFSHSGYTDPEDGHGPFGLENGDSFNRGNHVVDKTYYDVPKTLRMAYSTWKAMKDWAKLKCNCKGNDWDNSWFDQIKRFAELGPNWADARVFDIEGNIAGSVGHPIWANHSLLRAKSSALGIPMR